MNPDIVFSQKYPGFLISPTRKLISADFILIPTYKDVVQVKAQIRWFEGVAEFFKGVDEEVAKGYADFANLLRARLQRIAR